MKLTLIRALTKLVFYFVSFLTYSVKVIAHAFILLLFALVMNFVFHRLHLPGQEHISVSLIFGSELIIYFLCRLALFFILVCKGG